MAEQSIELVENHGASLELSSDGYAYVTVEAEFSNIPETGVAIEAQIILYKEDTIVSASDPADCEITSESPIFWLSDTFFLALGKCLTAIVFAFVSSNLKIPYQFRLRYLQRYPVNLAHF